MEDYIKAHQYSSNHRKQLLNDAICGYFFCLSIYDSKEVVAWIEDYDGTAIYPYCSIDSVIKVSSGFPITKEFLKKMHDHWF